jgi:fatty acid desaturase
MSYDPLDPNDYGSYYRKDIFKRRQNDDNIRAWKIAFAVAGAIAAGLVGAMALFEWAISP